MARSPRTPSSHAASTTAGPLFEAEVSTGRPAPRTRIGLIPVALVGTLVAGLARDEDFAHGLTVANEAAARHVSTPAA